MAQSDLSATRKWRCPLCFRRFSLKPGIPEPDACPDCKKELSASTPTTFPEMDSVVPKPKGHRVANPASTPLDSLYVVARLLCFVGIIAALGFGGYYAWTCREMGYVPYMWAGYAACAVITFSCALCLFDVYDTLRLILREMKNRNDHR